MDREDKVCSVCGQLVRAIESISSLSDEVSRIGGSDSLCDVYRDMQLADLEHAQILVLKLTALLTESRMDESAFMPGELNSQLGEFEKEYQEPAEPEERE